MNRIFLIIFLVTISFFSQGQSIPKKPIQFSGVVMSSDSLQALPFAVVVDKNTQKGTYANLDGFFSFVSFPGDTVQFSYLGFFTRTIIIPSQLAEDKYSIIQLLSADTFNLPVTIIRPYPKPEEFKQAFISLKLPTDDGTRAAVNLQKMNIASLNIDLAMDGRENQLQYYQSYAKAYSYKGQLPPMGVFNMAAWYDFLTAWKRGDFKNKKKYY
jgi:hypothetical protein